MSSELLRWPLLAFIATAALCQDKPAAGAAQKPDAALQRKLEAQGLAQKSEEADGGGKGEGVLDEKGNLVKLDSGPPPPRTAAGFCRLEGSVTPKSLLPGETGKLRIVMMMENGAVLPAPPRLVVEQTPGQGMEVGAMTMEPARIGRLEKAYLGKPVYDNWAVLEMPVTMSRTAALGQQMASAVDLDFDLFQGATGNQIGTFRDRVVFRCQVGLALNPAIQSVGHAPAVGDPHPAETSPSPVAPAAAANSATPPVAPDRITAHASVPAPGPTAPSNPGSEPPPMTAQEASNSTVLVVGAVALFAVIGLLLLKRR